MLPMADRFDKHPLNVPGAFYNDSTCIDCDICREIAPAFFRRDDDAGASYVWKQPASPEEFQLAREAMESCPSDTIGCDG
jgi:ferredoxin